MQCCKRIAAGLLCLLLTVLCSLPAIASDFSEGLLQALSGGDMDTWVNETLPENAGRGAEWYVLALVRGEYGYDFSEYAASLTAYFSNERVSGAVERQRIALTLLALGADSTIPDTVAAESIDAQGIMSWVFGLHLVQNGAQGAEMSAEEIASELAALQLEDGGWALSGDYADTDVTAMVLQALAGQRERFEDVIARGVACLSEKQREDGGFASYGVSNSESVSQVIIALTALGIDPRTDERFVKSGGGISDAWARFHLSDGSFSHTEGGTRNEHATQQALLAAVALARFDSGKSGIYLFEQRDATSPTESSAEETIPEQTTPEPESEPSPTADGGISAARVVTILIASAAILASLLYLLLGKA